MEILLVEDDNFKKERIINVLKGAGLQFTFTWASSVKEAIQFIETRVFDHIILDIALPSHKLKNGGSEGLQLPSGGIEILLELSYEERSDPVTIITQYPEIELDDDLVVPPENAKSQIKSWLGLEIRSAIYFVMSEVAWEKELLSSLGKQK